MDNNLRYLLLQTTVADYRDEFVRALRDKLGAQLTLVCGVEYFQSSIRISQFARDLPGARLVANTFLLDRKLCWQHLPWRQIISADVVVLELNPRIISSWAVLLIRGILQKPTIGWGHAWARAGLHSRTEVVRHAVRSLCSGLLFYTKTQLLEFSDRYPNFKRALHVCPNALYSSAIMRFKRDAARASFVYVGRLVEEKKVGVLVKAFQQVRGVTDALTLELVGDGPDAERIDSLIATAPEGIRRHGHISELAKLSEIYSGAIASVSPGYVGLSITQSLSFGVPVIVSRKEPHAPEIEALRDGFNGSFFDTDNVSSLAGVMLDYLAERSEWAARGEAISDDCRSRYSIEAMSSGFLTACAHQLGG